MTECEEVELSLSCPCTEVFMCDYHEWLMLEEHELGNHKPESKEQK